MTAIMPFALSMSCCSSAPPNIAVANPFPSRTCFQSASCLQKTTPAAATTQRAPPPATKPPAFPATLQPGLPPQSLARTGPKPTFRPTALRLDDQGREIDEFGNLVQTKTESVTTLKVSGIACKLLRCIVQHGAFSGGRTGCRNGCNAH